MSEHGCPCKAPISITTCAAINQNRGEQSSLAEEPQKENALQAILQKVVINNCQLKAATENSSAPQPGGWEEAGEEQGVHLLLKTETHTTPLFCKDTKTIAKYTFHYRIYRQQNEATGTESCRGVRGRRAKGAMQEGSTGRALGTGPAALVPPRGTQRYAATSTQGGIAKSHPPLQAAVPGIC